MNNNYNNGNNSGYNNLNNNNNYNNSGYNNLNDSTNNGYNNVNNSNNNNYNSYNGGNKNDNNSLSGKQAAKAYIIIFLIAGILLFIYFSDSDDKKKAESSNVNETVSNSNIQQTPTSNIPQSVPSNKPSNQAPVASNKTSNKAPVTSNKTSNKAPVTSNKTSNKAPVNTGEIKISKLAFIDYVQNSEVWVKDTLDISEFLMVVPENANAKGITYKSSNASVATVDNNGNVKALKVGNVKITATAPSGASATLSLKVVSKPPMEFFVNGSDYSISYGDLTLNIVAISNESCISNNSCSGQIEIDFETGDGFYYVKTNTGKYIIDGTNYLMEPITRDGQIIIKVYEPA